MSLFKRLTCVFTALIMVISGLFSVSAFAEEEEAAPQLTYKISYTNKYTYLELTPSNSKNVIRYTTDGSAPYKGSKVYKKKLRTSNGATVRATEYTKKGEIVDTVKVTLKRKCCKPEMFALETKGGYKVALVCETKGVSIHYTVDGSKPNGNSPVYVDPFIVEKGDTVRFYAGKYGWKSSAVVKSVVKDSNISEEEFPETVVKVSATPKVEYDEQAMQVLELINKEREKKGLEPLEMNIELCAAAQIRADEMIDYYELGHTRPNGEHWSTVLTEVGYNYQTAGENTRRCEGSKANHENVVKVWMDSKAHRANILNEWGNETGLAWAKKGNYTYWVQIFGEQK